MSHIRDHHPLAAKALFLAPHLVLAIWQYDRMCSQQWETGENSVPMKRLSIFTFRARFQTTALFEVYVTRSESVVHLKSSCHFASDEDISGPRHSIIELSN